MKLFRDYIKTFVGAIKMGRENDNTTLEEDGTLVANGLATCWDDQRHPVNGARLDSNSGRIDYNFAECTVDYNDNARYPEEPLSIIAQMSHARKNDSDIFPHIHWVQNQNQIPNILVEYRWYNNNELVPASFSQAIVDTTEYSYASGNLLQISSIPLPLNNGLGKNLSSIIDVKIYRDSLNTSGLFPGVDAYTGSWSLKEFDIHIEIDMNGSRQEFIK